LFSSGEAHLKSEAVEKGIRTRVYQAHAWHKHFPELLIKFNFRDAK
jgi:hypothetical protein